MAIAYAWRYCVGKKKVVRWITSSIVVIDVIVAPIWAFSVSPSWIAPALLFVILLGGAIIVLRTIPAEAVDTQLSQPPAKEAP